MVPSFATLPLAGANGRCRDMPNAASHVKAPGATPVQPVTRIFFTFKRNTPSVNRPGPGRQGRADKVLNSCSASASTRPGTAKPRLLLDELCTRDKGPGQHLIKACTTKLARPRFAEFSSGPRKPRTVRTRCKRSSFRRVRPKMSTSSALTSSSKPRCETCADPCNRGNSALGTLACRLSSVG